MSVFLPDKSKYFKSISVTSSHCRGLEIISRNWKTHVVLNILHSFKYYNQKSIHLHVVMVEVCDKVSKYTLEVRKWGECLYCKKNTLGFIFYGLFLLWKRQKNNNSHLCMSACFRYFTHPCSHTGPHPAQVSPAVATRGWMQWCQLVRWLQAAWARIESRRGELPGGQR